MKARNLRRLRPRVEELEGRLVPSTILRYTSNWSGYAVATNPGAVTAVSGSWVVPTASPSAISAFSSAWVGIDGANSNTVEQIGTDSDFVGGKPQYYAWYEMYPAGSVNLSLTITPGDTIAAAVVYTGPNQFSLSLTDVTSGASFSTTQTSPRAKRSSADWVQEAPSGLGGTLPLANFGSIAFSGDSATISGKTGAIDNSTWTGSTLYQMNMSSRTGPKATTSVLTDSGIPATSGFKVTWDSLGVSFGHSRFRRSPDQTDAAQQAAAVLNTVGASAFALPITRLMTGPAIGPAFGMVQPSLSFVGAQPLLAQPAVTVPNRTTDPGDAKAPSADQPGTPELLPPPTEVPAAPAGAPANAEPAPSPSDMLPGAALDVGRANDDHFADGRWEPTATFDAPHAAPTDDAPTVESPGLVLTLALGGIWGIATREAAERRRRQIT
jgi:hypothetical protein